MSDMIRKTLEHGLEPVFVGGITEAELRAAQGVLDTLGSDGGRDAEQRQFEATLNAHREQVAKLGTELAAERQTNGARDLSMWIAKSTEIVRLRAEQRQFETTLQALRDANMALDAELRTWREWARGKLGHPPADDQTLRETLDGIHAAAKAGVREMRSEIELAVRAREKELRDEHEKEIATVMGALFDRLDQTARDAQGVKRMERVTRSVALAVSGGWDSEASHLEVTQACADAVIAVVEDLRGFVESTLPDVPF